LRAHYHHVTLWSTAPHALPIECASLLPSAPFLAVIQAPQIPPYWIWAYYLSYLQYTLSIFAMNQWPPGEDDGWVKCQGDFCTPWTNEYVSGA
jgi:hypothetical protein